jgi:hypothetical protein
VASETPKAGGGISRSVFRTPTATCGLRGTEFTVAVDAQGQSDFTPLAGVLDITSRKD